MSFDLFKEIELVTKQWRLAHNLEPKMTEDRDSMIARWEREGRLDPNCPGCREFYESPKLPVDVFAPSHKASNGCESGKRNHCTCDTCF